MVKKFREMLENYAEEVNFPYEPVGSEDVILSFSRHFRFCSGPFDDVIFEHDIEILNTDKENPVAAVSVGITVTEKPDEKLVDEINKLMGAEYGLIVFYKDELKDFSVGYLQMLNAITIEKMMDNGIDDLFIRRIYYFGRLMLQTYVNAVNNGMDVKTAFSEAKDEICEVDVADDVEIFYELVKDIDENNGERRFIEREILLKSFYSNPEYFVKKFSKKKGRILNEHIEDIRAILDFHISDRADGYQKYKVKVKKDGKLIHMRLPEAVRSGDCTDIFVSERSGGAPVLATVEYNYDLDDDRKRYVACIRSADNCCMVAGVFRKHRKAVEFMKEKLSSAA